MPTVNLNPDSTYSNDWPTLSGSTVHGALSDSSTTTYIRTPDANDACVVTLGNYSSGGTIDSIRFAVSGYTFLTRGGDTDIRVRIMHSSGTYYSENVTLNFNGYVAQDHYGTARTTSDGSSAWTDSDLDGLRLEIDTSPEDPPSVSQATVVKAWVEVTYTAASGYGNNVNGIAAANISKVNGIATASISKVNGI